MTRTPRYKWKRAAALRAHSQLAHMFPVQYVSLFLEELLRDPRHIVMCHCGHAAVSHKEKYGECRDGCGCLYMRPDIEFRGFNV